MKKKGPPSKNPCIMGAHALSELLKHAPDRILCVYTSFKEEGSQRKHSLILECEKKGVFLERASSSFLTSLAGSDSHQSFVARIKNRHLFQLKEFLQKYGQKETLFLLLLDAIYDPQNFGALLRSAECFGVDGVLWSKNRGCDITPVVAKASCGASELVKLIRVSNLAESVELLKEEGFDVLAADTGEGAKSLFSTCYQKKTALIMGSEGEGIQPLLKKRANQLISIPLKGKISSLNVAQAASIFLSWKEASSIRKILKPVE